MDKSINGIILAAIITVITTVMGFFLGKRKTNAETSLTEVETINKAVSIWRQLAQDLKKEVDDLRSIVEDLKHENEKLNFEILKLKNSRP